MQRNITLIAPYSLIFYSLDDVEKLRYEEVIESVLEDGENVIATMRKYSERANVPFQEVLNSYANELILKKLNSATFQKMVKKLEEKYKGKLRVELKISGDVHIK